ncbi:hypothetical protein [Effusibacillus dendaii]|uniref:Uncharacterized protein n=1 Tax=Effusibacillus dendaii TaxID=2743772 RepID=A0A7I8D794_9BACL|nr:hypothetical protein [Effusibacillus dendaii]BCJ85945.1 hypothetical protein skT53_09300 [Effusibacillus dendaii]
MNRLVAGIMALCVSSVLLGGASGQASASPNANVVSSAETNTGPDIALQNWVNWIAAANSDFATWKGASVTCVLSEEDTAGGVSVWHVENEGRDLGYLVTADQNRILLEYSSQTPPPIMQNRAGGVYRYAGPGMHLYQATGQPKWVNLSNGETLPDGTPVAYRLPAGLKTAEDSVKTKPQQAANVKQETFQTDLNPDRGVAVMISHGTGNSQPFSTQQLADPQGGYLVYTALPKDYYSVWAVQARYSLDSGLSFLQVQDVFAATKAPIYVPDELSVSWVASK